jgi:hypothetical protein
VLNCVNLITTLFSNRQTQKLFISWNFKWKINIHDEANSSKNLLLFSYKVNVLFMYLEQIKCLTNIFCWFGFSNRQLYLCSKINCSSTSLSSSLNLLICSSMLKLSSGSKNLSNKNWVRSTFWQAHYINSSIRPMRHFVSLGLKIKSFYIFVIFVIDWRQDRTGDFCPIQDC